MLAIDWTPTKKEAKAIEQAKEWLANLDAPTMWALMRLELMEDYAPDKLRQEIADGTLMDMVKRDQEELSEKEHQMTISGDYNNHIDLHDQMRADLIAEAESWQEMEDPDSLLEQALRGRKLTEEEKDYLRDVLPPWLASQVDLLP